VKKNEEENYGEIDSMLSEESHGKISKKSSKDKKIHKKTPFSKKIVKSASVAQLENEIEQLLSDDD